MDFSVGKFLGQGQGNTAGACADVGDAKSDFGPWPSDRRQWNSRRGLRSAVCGLQFEHGFDDVLGLGARDQHGWRDYEVHAPEFLMSRDVLCGNAASALGKSGIIAAGLFGGEFALGMSVQVGAVAVEGEHEEQFGIYAWGRNLIFGQAGDGVRQCDLQLHRDISSSVIYFACPFHW